MWSWDFALDSDTVLNNLASTRTIPCRIDVLYQPQEGLDAGYEIGSGLPDGVWSSCGCGAGAGGVPAEGLLDRRLRAEQNNPHPGVSRDGLGRKDDQRHDQPRHR